MNISDYFTRIGFKGSADVSEETLMKLHECHVLSVPFENLDVHYKRLFDLKEENIFNKVINNRRGGFCYELNYLFHLLLTNLGFSSRMISARTYNQNGSSGPDYDHLLLLVTAGRQFIADVGYGDLFIRPLELKTGIQTEGNNSFRIEKLANEDYLLSMAAGKSHFEKRYDFNLKECSIDLFRESCLDKQVNPESFFVINTLCTMPTLSGRVTIFNNKLIERSGDKKSEVTIRGDSDLRLKLREKFNITI